MTTVLDKAKAAWVKWSQEGTSTHWSSQDPRAAFIAGYHHAALALVETGEPVAAAALLDAYEAKIKETPIGHEMPTRGASTYNWRMSILKELRGMMASPPDDVMTEEEVLNMADGDEDDS